MFRVLQPGATIRISAPDGERYLYAYIGVGEFSWTATDGKSIGYTPIMSVNRIFYRDEHRFIYDFRTLEMMLRNVGFVDIRKEQFGSGRDARLLVEQPARAIESLYVEASKPH